MGRASRNYSFVRNDEPMGFASRRPSNAPARAVKPNRARVVKAQKGYGWEVRAPSGRLLRRSLVGFTSARSATRDLERARRDLLVILWEGIGEARHR